MSLRMCLLLAACWCCLSNQSEAANPVRYIQQSPATGSSAAVVVDGLPLVQTSQLDSLDEQGRRIGAQDVEQQVQQVLRNLDRVLKLAGSSLDRSVKLNVYVARDDAAAVVQQSLATAFPNESKPAVSYVVTALPQPEALLAMDAIAVTRDNSTRDKVETRIDVSSQKGSRTRAADPRVTILPTGSRIYISGQAEKAPKLGEATRLTLLSLEASLKYCGRTRADISHVKCFLEPMTQVSEVYRELETFFAPHAIPAVSYVEWESNLPIEIEVVAYGGSAAKQEPVTKIEFLTPPALTPSPVFSRITRIHHPTTIFISGLFGDTGADGAQQVEQIFDQLGSLLKATGSDFRHLAKATYYVSQDEPSRKLNELRPKYYAPNSPPAASKAQVRGVGKSGTGLTLDMIAVPAT